MTLLEMQQKKGMRRKATVVCGSLGKAPAGMKAWYPPGKVMWAWPCPCNKTNRKLATGGMAGSGCMGMAEARVLALHGKASRRRVVAGNGGL